MSFRFFAVALTRETTSTETATVYIPKGEVSGEGEAMERAVKLAEGGEVDRWAPSDITQNDVAVLNTERVYNIPTAPAKPLDSEGYDEMIQEIVALVLDQWQDHFDEETGENTLDVQYAISEVTDNFSPSDVETALIVLTLSGNPEHAIQQFGGGFFDGKGWTQIHTTAAHYAMEADAAGFIDDEIEERKEHWQNQQDDLCRMAEDWKDHQADGGSWPLKLYTETFGDVRVNEQGHMFIGDRTQVHADLSNV